MRVLLVVAHPCADAYAHACADAARKALIGAGHDVDAIDLYAEGFDPAMSAEERKAYETERPIVHPQVADHAELVRGAEAIVFVYPTWWSGLPAILKGWLDRVLVPTVAFTLDPDTHKVRPGLKHVRRLAGISTYGSPRRHVLLINDNGRRTITRALRMACAWRTRSTWLALYAMDTATDVDRARFLERITTKLGRW